MSRVNYRVRKETGKYQFDIQLDGIRVRPQTNLKANRANEKQVDALAKRMNAEIELGTFNIESYFPNSEAAKKVMDHFRAMDAERTRANLNVGKVPTFSEFCNQWIEENTSRWRRSTLRYNVSLISKHLLPTFGKKSVSDITREDLIAFRTKLTKAKSRNSTNTLSNRTVNSVMTVLKTIMDEAAYRFQISKVTERIQKLRQPKTKVQPFSLREVFSIIDHIHPDYRNYITVRFFTGMRPSELHALTWEKIDFDRREIVIDVTINGNDLEEDDTKNEFSERVITMNQLVFDALKQQRHELGNFSRYVFCNSTGGAVDTKNFQERIWKPVLTKLGLTIRRPYQTRHTAATLWLSSGENPEWIARQMGHSSTQMLFTIYSRWVPNLTRRDGSAFEAMLQNNGFNNGENEGEAA